jgi:very-short-patch-repair endonuclease
MWQNEQFREQQITIRKNLWKDTEFARKHIERCLRAQTPARREQLSKTSKQLWEDPQYAEKQREAKLELWRKPEFRQAQADFKTPEFRLKAAAIQTTVMADPARRSAISAAMTAKWLDPAYRLNQSIKQRETWTPERRQASKLAQSKLWLNPDFRAKYEKMWASPEYRQQLAAIITEKWKQPEYRAKASAAAKARWQDAEYKRRMIESICKLWHDPAYRHTRSCQSKEMWLDPKYQHKMGIHRSMQIRRLSSLEKITATILSAMQLNYQSQVPTGPWIFDFVLPDLDIFIECQGEYWHSLPGRQSRDSAKLAYLERSKPQARLLYLLERDFINPECVADKIKNFITGDIPVIEPVSFSFSQLSIRSLESKEAANFLNAYHYAGFGRHNKISYGAFLDNELIAVCKFTPIIRKEVATSMEMEPNSLLELDRFCIHPNFHKKNLASWFICRAVKLASSSFTNIKAFVSFADMTYGHIGTIYSVSNWLCIGTVQPDYCYVNDQGFVLHKKTLYNHAVKMGRTERQYAEENNYTKVWGKEKKKFVLFASPSKRKYNQITQA